MKTLTAIMALASFLLASVCAAVVDVASDLGHQTASVATGPPVPNSADFLDEVAVDPASGFVLRCPDHAVLVTVNYSDDYSDLGFGNQGPGDDDVGRTILPTSDVFDSAPRFRPKLE